MGTTELCRDKEQIWVIGVQKIGAPKRRNQEGRLSGPAAVAFNESNALNTWCSLGQDSRTSGAQVSLGEGVM